MSTTAPSTATIIRLVAVRDIKARVRAKSFIISTAILLLGVLASVVVGGFLAGNQQETPVAVVGSAVQADALTGVEVVEAADRAEAETLVTEGEVDAAIIQVPESESPLGIAVLAETSAPSEVMAQLGITPPVILLGDESDESGLTFLIAAAFGAVFMFSALTFGTTITQNVVEEKQTRIVEILLATVPVSALLAGKVIGNSILAFGQIIAIAALATIGLGVTGQSELLTVLSAPMLWFVGFFIVGFVLLAAMFAAAGALVSRQEDVGATMTPIMGLVMLPYFLIITMYQNPLVVSIMSYVPFSAPVAMPVRLFLGTAEWWEPLLSLAILLATAVGIIALGARIYRNSLLRTGARVPLAQALKR